MTTAAVEPVIAKTQYGWFQTDEEKASVVAMLRLPITGEPEGYVLDVPLDRYVRVDATGNLRSPEFSGTSMVNADGASGKAGFGFNCLIDVDEQQSRDEWIVLRIYCSWTTAGQARGELHDTLRVQLNRNSTISLKDGANVKVTWRKGSKFQLTESNAVKRLMETKHVAGLNPEVPGRKLVCHVEKSSPSAIELYLEEDHATQAPRLGYFRVNEIGEVFANGSEADEGESWWKID